MGILLLQQKVSASYYRYTYSLILLQSLMTLDVPTH